jgi:hypothetical protein
VVGDTLGVGQGDCHQLGHAHLQPRRGEVGGGRGLSGLCKDRPEGRVQG